jgi:hypothetical protein
MKPIQEMYDVYINDEDQTGTDKISLVESPAIMEDFIFMNSESPEVYKKIVLSADEKRIITGPALIPNIEIIRKDEDGNPYFIRYSAEQIEKIAQKFFKTQSQFSVNKDHSTDVKGVWIYESWLSTENDKAKTLGFDVPVGTWMVSMKVEDDEIWQGIKDGKYKGFSIEGLFRFKKADYKKKVKQESDDYLELSEDQESVVLTHLKSVGVSEAELIELAEADAITGYSDSDLRSTYALSTTPKNFYVYTGDISDNSRDFCTEMISLNRLYTFQDLQAASNLVVNEGFGPGGTDTYNVWLFKGGANCKHHWDKYFISKQNGVYTKVYGGKVSGRPGQDPFDMPKRGFLEKVDLSASETTEIDQASISNPAIQKFLNTYSDFEANRLLQLLSELRRLVKLEEVALVYPSASETESEFIGRCMSEIEGEFPDQDQRLAVCYTYWEKQSQQNNNIKMKSTNLKNGTTIYTDAEAFEVGVEVYLLDGETKVTPPAEAHELEDGTIVTTDESGIITEIQEAVVEPVEEPEVEEQAAEPVAQEDMYDMAGSMEAVKGMLENISMKLDLLLGSEVAQQLEQMAVKLEKIALAKEIAEALPADNKVNLASENKKPRLDYNTIIKTNRKF